MSQADEEEPLLAPEAAAALMGALEAALRPAELDPSVNERLIELALEDPLAPATDEELAESARLRDALEQGAPHEVSATLEALRSAFEAPGPSQPSVDASIEQAIDGALTAAPAHEAKTRPRTNVVFAVFGAASAALAAAALFMLFVGSASRSEPAPALASELAKPRSTAPLFSERFETGDTTARMDAIASARSRELRDNRYASWGVR